MVVGIGKVFQDVSCAQLPSQSTSENENSLIMKTWLTGFSVDYILF